MTAAADKRRLAEMGERFWTARSQLNMTMREAAGAAGLSNAFICQVENGQARISLDRAAKLAAVYAVSLDWLATGRPPAGTPGEGGE